ncbi:hypothetical protein BH10PAT3_BH10PAT3_3300 [soil metagenome]
MRAKRLITIVLTVFIVLLPVLGFWQRLAIFDLFRLHGYQPPVSVSQLATDTTMEESTRRLFYVYHPAIEDKSKFNDACRGNEQTIVLGCYVSGLGIYLLDVSDSRLNGVEQVTAAHETLHAAYARLSSSERKKINAMTATAFSSLTDQRVKDTIELYRKQDASVIPNELHSILGTEVRNLPEDLETYYRQYFKDRSQVVGYSEQYEQAFTDRKNQILAFDTQLSALKEQIDQLQVLLERSATSLSQEREKLDSERSSGNLNAYNDGVGPYNSHVVSYNRQVDQLSALVAQYNDIVPKRNAVALEEQDLVQAIDSRRTVPARQ